MIYADSKSEIAAKRKAFICKWRLKCRAVADSLEEAGDKLFTFPRYPKSQWKSLRGDRGDAVLGSAGFWSDHNAQVDGWRSLAAKPSDQTIDRAA